MREDHESLKDISYNRIGQTPVYSPGERQAIAQPPTFQDIVQGLRHAVERVGLMASHLEDLYGGITGNYAPPSKEQLTQATPSGVIPELSVLLQEVHLQLGRGEKALSAIRSL